MHNPVSFGHTEYNREVKDYLYNQVFNQLKSSEDHPKPKNIRSLLMKAQDTFWGRLVKRGSGKGGGGLSGVDANFRARYGKAKNGWWKPMCMSAEVNSAPVSPGLV